MSAVLKAQSALGDKIIAHKIKQERLSRRTPTLHTYASTIQVQAEDPRGQGRSNGGRSEAIHREWSKYATKELAAIRDKQTKHAPTQMPDEVPPTLDEMPKPMSDLRYRRHEDIEPPPTTRPTRVVTTGGLTREQRMLRDRMLKDLGQ